MDTTSKLSASSRFCKANTRFCKTNSAYCKADDVYYQQAGNLRRGYILALVLLASVSCLTFIVLCDVIQIQGNVNQLVLAAKDQQKQFSRVNQIVALVLHEVDQKTLTPDLAEQMRVDLQDVAKKIRDNMMQLQNVTADHLHPSLFFIDEPVNYFRDENVDINAKTRALVDRIDEIVGSSIDYLAWRFSLWAPILMNVAPHGSLAQDMNTAYAKLAADAESTQQQLAKLHIIFSSLTLFILFLEGLLIFRPLLNRLRSAHKEVENQNAQLIKEMRNDKLTKLGNRIALFELLNKLQEEQSEQISILIFDIDNFKINNNIFGYAAGDKCLVTCAVRLKRLCRHDGRLFRVGGDEFVLVCTEKKDYANLIGMAEYAQERLREPIHIENSHLHTTASIGIAMGRHGDGLSAEDIMLRANHALRMAKENECGRMVVYDKKYEELARSDEKMAECLLDALKKNEIQPYYQPIHDPYTHEIIGFEALARWNSKLLGDVSPGKFIPLAQRCGLLNALSDSIYKQVFHDRGAFVAVGLEQTFISINMPECVLVDSCITQRLSLLNPTGDFSWLHVEVTEDVALTRSDRVIADNLERLTNMGIALSLDDFGTGHASLSHLQSIPCKVLKIDKSFIERLPGFETSTVIVESMIRLAHSLDMQVIAEGVEVQEQLEVVKVLGCDAIQGYYYSAALPLHDVLEYADKQRRDTSYSKDNSEYLKAAGVK